MECQYSSCNYIYNINPSKYGGQQEDYQAEIRKCINSGVNEITISSKDEKSLTELFFTLFSNVCTKRQNIALKHNTPCADKFGRRRDVVHPRVPDFHVTILDQEYTTYNKKFLSSIAALMQSMQLDRKSAEKKTKKISDETSTFELEVLEMDHLNQLKWNIPLTASYYPAGFPHPMMDRRATTGINNAEAIVAMEAMRKIKQSNSSKSHDRHGYR